MLQFKFFIDEDDALLILCPNYVKCILLIAVKPGDYYFSAFI